jgi:hypothetical protein
MKESAGGASDMTDDALIDAAKLQADLERSATPGQMSRRKARARKKVTDCMQYVYLPYIGNNNEQLKQKTSDETCKNWQHSQKFTPPKIHSKLHEFFPEND